MLLHNAAAFIMAFFCSNIQPPVQPQSSTPWKNQQEKMKSFCLIMRIIHVCIYLFLHLLPL